jgi:phosphatidylserine/phosphatidylglycerophosphate/cardiolipin synthase-like enzyme
MMALQKSKFLRFAARFTIAALFLVILTAGQASAATYSARATLLPNREFAEAFIAAIRSAKKSIHLSFFLFKATDANRNIPRQIVDELVRAKKRGVDVAVILERPSRGRPASGGDSLEADNRRTASLLSQGGIKVNFDSPAVTTHTKAAVIDGRLVFVGSHNLTQSALLHNNELSVMFDSPELAAEVEAFIHRR